MALSMPAFADAGITTYGDLDITYEQTTTSFSPPPSRAQQSSYQPCDTGLRDGLLLLSGGGWIADTDPMVTPFELGQAYFAGLKFRSQVPPSEPDSWHEIVDNVSANGSLSLGEVTVCGDVSGLSYESTHKPVGKKDTGSYKAKCGGGEHVLGGGGVMKGRFGKPLLLGSSPYDGRDAGEAFDDGWKVTGYNGTTRTRKIHAYAVCAPLTGLDYLDGAFTASPGSRWTSQVACGAGTYAIGGGFGLDGPLKKARLVQSRTQPPGSGWNVTVDNLSASKTLGLDVFAICHA
jgi:hypothetical protein